MNVSYDDENHYIRVKDANGVWHNAVYYNYNEPEALVPVMTSNTTPSGEAFASSEMTSAGITYYAYRAFAGNFANPWHATANVVSGYVGYDFGRNVQCTKAILYPYMYTGQDSRVKTYKIQASTDLATWVDLTEIQTAPNERGGTYNAVPQSVIFTKNVGMYRAYRVYIIDGYATAGAAVAGLQFYGYEED